MKLKLAFLALVIVMPVIAQSSSQSRSALSLQPNRVEYMSGVALVIQRSP